MSAARAGFGIRPGRDRAADVTAYVEAGGADRTGLAGLLDHLDRRGRRSLWAPGLRVTRALTWDAADRRDRGWWPQGIGSSADARLEESEPDRVHGRRLLAVTWWGTAPDGRNDGSRVSFYDLDTRRYQHADLVRVVGGDAGPVVEPLRSHAGGLVWHGPWLLVASTSRGLWACHLDDVLRRPGGRFVLPVRQAWPAVTDEGAEPFRWSFLSLSRTGGGPAIVAGEYARGARSRRLLRMAVDPRTRLPRLDEDGVARPSYVAEGVAGMQGAAERDGVWHCTVSHGPRGPGSWYVGRPGSLRHARFAVPVGPEDLCWWPEHGRLWTVTEHPRRRWLSALRPAAP